jgi:hypothetical protein
MWPSLKLVLIFRGRLFAREFWDLILRTYRLGTEIDADSKILLSEKDAICPSIGPQKCLYLIAVCYLVMAITRPTWHLPHSAASWGNVITARDNGAWHSSSRPS